MDKTQAIFQHQRTRTYQSIVIHVPSCRYTLARGKSQRIGAHSLVEGSLYAVVQCGDPGSTTPEFLEKLDRDLLATANHVTPSHVWPGSLVEDMVVAKEAWLSWLHGSFGCEARPFVWRGRGAGGRDAQVSVTRAVWMRRKACLACEWLRVDAMMTLRVRMMEC